MGDWGLATTTTHAPTQVGAAAPAGGTARSNGSDGRLPTPSRLWVSLIAAALALLAVGTACALTLSGRQASESRAVNSAEHLVVNVDKLYHSLADADATAATALLVGPVAPARLTDQYNTDITQSENALAGASRDLAGDDRASAQLEKVAAQLPTYTALIATAQADNRLGYPVGAAYLREASGFLRGTILPEVGAVAQEEAAAQDAAQNSVSGVPIWLLVAAVLAALLLVRVWRELSRSTRRRVNTGLAAGVLLAAALLAWAVVGTASATGSAHAAESDFHTVTALLQDRENLALAQSFQSLTLIDRGEDNGADAKGEAAALNRLAGIGSMFDTHSKDKFDALTAQTASVDKAVSGGDYYKAVDLTVGHGSQQSTDTVIAKAAALDTALVTQYNTAQHAYEADAGSAGSALSGGLWIGLIGGLAAAAFAGYGINRRLAEYR
jgi:hypothetical protein